MKLFSNEHVFKHPWNSVTLANWVKYPSELTPHVVHVDYLSRRIDPATGILHTVRLLTCRQAAPDFILRLMGVQQNTSYVYEHSQVDPAERSYIASANNLTFSHLITVEEVCHYAPHEKDAENSTMFKQEARITSISGGLSYVRNSIEDFCIKRFQTNATKGRDALEQVLDKIYTETKEQLLERFCHAKNTTRDGGTSASPAITTPVNTTAAPSTSTSAATNNNPATLNPAIIMDSSSNCGAVLIGAAASLPA